MTNLRSQEFHNSNLIHVHYTSLRLVYQHTFSNSNSLFGFFFFFSSSSLNNISSTDVKRSGVKSSGSEGSAPINNSVIPVDYKSFKATWTEVVHINRERWRAKVPKGKVLLGNLVIPLRPTHKARHCHP